MSLVYRVADQQGIELAGCDPDHTAGLRREEAQAQLQKVGEELGDLQEFLYAAGQHTLLVVLQGMDTSGKDGAIRNVFRFIDPQGCRVQAFRKPTALELSHDFLWRVHRAVPERGMVGVFNRSHYEDVLAARVRNLVPVEVWSRRYEHINAFERLLSDSDTIIAKFYLHISRAEQEERLLAREREVAKAWKLSAVDWLDRHNWEAYVAAYEEVFRRCTSETAPWYIVPANRKWYRNLAIADTLVHLLRPYRQTWLTTLHERGERELAAIHEARANRE